MKGQIFIDGERCEFTLETLKKEYVWLTGTYITGGHNGSRWHVVRRFGAQYDVPSHRIRKLDDMKKIDDKRIIRYVDGRQQPAQSGELLSWIGLQYDRYQRLRVITPTEHKEFEPPRRYTAEALSVILGAKEARVYVLGRDREGRPLLPALPSFVVTDRD